VTHCLITKDVVLGKGDPVYSFEERKQSA